MNKWFVILSIMVVSVAFSAALVTGCKEDNKKSSLPNLDESDVVFEASGRDLIKFEFEPGWGINEKAPTKFVMVLGGKKIKEWNRDEIIKNSGLRLDTLIENRRYLIEGTAFYCLKENPNRCLLQSKRIKLKAVPPTTPPRSLGVKFE